MQLLISCSDSLIPPVFNLSNKSNLTDLSLLSLRVVIFIGFNKKSNFTNLGRSLNVTPLHGAWYQYEGFVARYAILIEFARRLVDEVVAAAVLESVARAIEVFADDDEEGVQAIFAGTCECEERFEVLFRLAFEQIRRRFGGSDRLLMIAFRFHVRRAGGGIEVHHHDLGLRIAVGVGVVRKEADAHAPRARHRCSLLRTQ